MTAVGDFAVGEVLTAASLNEIGAWTSYTPTLTNLTLGNGTRVARYYKMNKIGFVSFDFTFGSTSAVTGDITISLPSGWTSAQTVTGLTLAVAAGTTYVMSWRTNAAGTSFLVRALNAAGTYLTNTNASSTIPGTWTTGDSIRFVATLDIS